MCGGFVKGVETGGHGRSAAPGAALLKFEFVRGLKTIKMTKL